MERVSKDIWQHQHLQWDFSIPIDSWLSSYQGRTPSLQDQQHLCVGPWPGQKWIPLFWCDERPQCNMFPWNLINQFDDINFKKKVCIFHLLCVCSIPLKSFPAKIRTNRLACSLVQMTNVLFTASREPCVVWHIAISCNTYVQCPLLNQPCPNLHKPSDIFPIIFLGHPCYSLVLPPLFFHLLSICFVFM